MTNLAVMIILQSLNKLNTVTKKATYFFKNCKLIFHVPHCRYAIGMLSVCFYIRMLSVYHPYAICMLLYVIRMPFLCFPYASCMLSVCLCMLSVFHLYTIRMQSVIRLLSVIAISMLYINHLYAIHMSPLCYPYVIHMSSA